MVYTIRDLRKKYYYKKIEENKDDTKGTWKILKYAMNKGNNATKHVLTPLFMKIKQLLIKN